MNTRTIVFYSYTNNWIEASTISISTKGRDRLQTAESVRQFHYKSMVIDCLNT